MDKKQGKEKEKRGIEGSRDGQGTRRGEEERANEGTMRERAMEKKKERRRLECLEGS